MGRKLAVAKQKYSSTSLVHEGKQLALRYKIEPKTFGQEMYLNCIEESTITLATGPAGTGKTWLATHVALQKLINNEIGKIVITKPILEAGDEEIGALPGEIDDKIGPHFAAILECFHDHIGPIMTKMLIEKGKLEMRPVAYMRGCTFKDAFIIIDEAQNLKRKALKLILTRLGENSMMVINGDSDQVDLKDVRDSGLDWAISCLRGKDSKISIAVMTDKDIQRNPLIRVILANLH